MTTDRDFDPPLPRNPRLALRQYRGHYRPRSRLQRLLAWLDGSASTPLGHVIEWGLVVGVIVALLALLARMSGMIDGDLDVSAKVVAERDAKARSVICAEVK